ncbi:MAG: HAD hydrolase-like protein, partial [Exiguobacterium undae]
MYRHVIWDFAGTLFDTYPVMASVFQQMLREQGREEPLETILETMKISANTMYVQYGFDPNSISEYKTRKAQDELQTVR